MAWLADFMKRMFERYPESENPIAEPAIVLLDEIDLHLHPDWQRKIIGFLSHHFPATQFIVTAHSPLIVQSADNVNVVLLEKEADRVKIHQPQIKTFKGWTVEEILSELMGLGEKTLSDSYLSLLKDFEEGLETENYDKAQKSYDDLIQILHPQSTQRKLLRMQLSALENDKTNTPA
jgi:predicted ATP-binding protein involved in virulence